MRALVQRVSEARVSVEARTVASIGLGLLVLCGVRADDTPADREWLAHKIATLRIFADAAGMMNRSLLDIGGAVLAVSQFTLFASTRKGARPSYSAAAPPDLAEPAFTEFVRALERQLGRSVATGLFGQHMAVALVNDGPVTIWLDTAARE